jgi:hypothetical protein
MSGKSSFVFGSACPHCRAGSNGNLCYTALWGRLPDRVGFWGIL